MTREILFFSAGTAVIALLILSDQILNSMLDENSESYAEKFYIMGGIGIGVATMAGYSFFANNQQPPQPIDMPIIARRQV